MERLEQELFKRLRAAYATWRAASAEYARTMNKYGGMLDDPDGARALYQAAVNERIAVQNYARSVKAISELVVQDRSPVAAVGKD